MDSQLRLDLDELNKVTTPYSRERNLPTYQYLLKQCHNKIIEYNKTHRSKFCYYRPPVYLMGKPVYNYQDLLNYLIENLTDNGLFTQITDHGLLICWDPKIQRSDEPIFSETKIRIAKPKKSKKEPPPPASNVISINGDDILVNANFRLDED